MACAMLPIAMCAQGTTQSSHHKLGSNIDYPINRLSPDGRYMGGWKNGVSYVYDTQMNQTLTTLGGDNLTVYLKSINNDGSIWASRIDNEGIKTASTRMASGRICPNRKDSREDGSVM